VNNRLSNDHAATNSQHPHCHLLINLYSIYNYYGKVRM
jgi:hypothetical protein